MDAGGGGNYLYVGKRSALTPTPLPEGEGSVIDVTSGTVTINCQISGAFVMNGNGTIVLGGGIGSCSSITENGGGLNLGGSTVTGLTTVTVTGDGQHHYGTLNVDSAIDLYSGSVFANLTGTAQLK